MEKKLDQEKEREKERIMKYLSDRTISKVRLRSDALNQIYEENKERLEDWKTCVLDQHQVELITDGLQPNHFNTRRSAFVLNDSSEIAMLCWNMTRSECERKFAKFFMDKHWKKKLGLKIRNQGSHLLCWGYVSTDLVSASLRRRHNNKIVPISVWHMCAYCKPWKLGEDPKNKVDHCYGCTSENGILHTQYTGGYKEKKKDKFFDCKNHFPPRDGVGEPFIEPELVKPRLIETLEAALEELKNQPVGADLLYYDGLMFRGVRVYDGPMHHHSHFRAYHSVTMVGVTRIDQELVVICKLSNGSLVGDSGYVYVSLATLYIPVGVTPEARERIRGYSTPQPLLSNFVVAERIVKEGEDDVDVDVDDDENDDDDDDDENEDEYSENEDEQDDDWKPEDEKEEDEAENANLKRIRLSSLPGYGSSWSCSLATATSKKLTLKKGHPEEEDSMESRPKDGIKTAETKMVSYSVGDAEELNLKEESCVSIPNKILKTLQTIREITGKQHSDEDIYAVYIECFNDPNETALKLLSLDTFHEVKNKRDKKKENVIQVTQGSSRNGGRNFPNQGYGRNHVAGGFRPSRPVSNRGRNFVGPRANRVSGPNGVGNGKAQVDVAVSVEKGLVEEHPPAKASFASVISAEPKPATKAIVEPVAKALEPVVNNEPKKLQPFTFGRQDTSEQVTENGTASNEVKDQSVLKADVGERSNVTFPFHIQAAKKLQNGLTFGSFGSDFVKEVSSNISASGGDESSHDEEDDFSPATNGIPEVTSARGASSFSDGKDQGDSHSTSENDQIVQPVEQALTDAEAHQIVYGHGAPLSMFGLVPSMPALGQPVNTEGAETQEKK